MLFLLLLLLLVASTAAQETNPPPSVSDWSSLLEEQQWSLGLRHETVKKEALRDSRTNLSRSDLFAQGYNAYTDDLTEERWTLSAARGFEGCTVFASLPLVNIERSGVTDTAASFSEDASGIGDLTVGITRLWRETEADTFVWSLAASLPTGSVDETDAGALVPYPMQPGSGTLEIVPGGAWTREGDLWTWGLALRGRLSIGRNDEDWSRGSSHVADLWAGRPLGANVSGRVGLRNSSWGDVHGGAVGLFPGDDPLDDDFLQGGARTDLVLGLEWARDDEDSPLAFHLELGLPVDEWLDGPQPSTDMILGFGVRFGF